MNYSTISNVRIVELSFGVVELAKKHFSEWNHTIFDNPRVQIEVNDARITLKNDSTKYDLILGDLFLPWLPGALLLMTSEHFELIKAKLEPDGVYVQWLPLFQINQAMFNDILKTAAQVFGSIYLFRMDQHFEQPSLAIVAFPSVQHSFNSSVKPEAFELFSGYIGQKSPLLQTSTVLNENNSIQRLVQTGGMLIGQPSADSALIGVRYLNWIAQVYKANPPESIATILRVSERTPKFAAKGFFTQQALYYQSIGESMGTMEMMKRAVEFGPSISTD